MCSTERPFSFICEELDVEAHKSQLWRVCSVLMVKCGTMLARNSSNAMSCLCDQEVMGSTPVRIRPLVNSGHVVDTQLSPLKGSIICTSQWVLMLCMIWLKRLRHY